MATYISLLRFTEQGAKNIKKSTHRAHDFDKTAENSGVKIVGQYWTLGLMTACSSSAPTPKRKPYTVSPNWLRKETCAPKRCRHLTTKDSNRLSGAKPLKLELSAAKSRVLALTPLKTALPSPSTNWWCLSMIAFAF
jgi:hypothetical protein